MCIGNTENVDDILPCQWVGLNESGSAVIQNGQLLINGQIILPLSQSSVNISDTERRNLFHMEPGRTMFMTMRVCNEAMLCTNKSLGSVTVTDERTILHTSEHGERIEVKYEMSNLSRKKRDAETLVVTTPNGEI